MITEVFLEQLEGIIQAGSSYIKDPSKAYDDVKVVIKYLETEIVLWRKEEAKWLAVIAQMGEVKKYGVIKFLAKKAMPRLDDNVLYVCQKNIEWRNSIVKQTYEEFAKLLKCLSELTLSIRNDLSCSGVKCLKEDGKTMEIVDCIIQSFGEKINYVKDAKTLITGDLSRTTKIESLLNLYINDLKNHADKVVQVKWDKEVWNQRITHIELPNFAVIQNFSAAHLEWKHTSTQSQSRSSTSQHHP